MSDLIAINAYIAKLEANGDLDHNCRYCQVHFYPAIVMGKQYSDIFAPRHKASMRCQSGQNAHCTCDICF